MKDILIGTMIGAIVMAAIFIPLLIYERHAKYKYGREVGKLDGLIEAASAIDEEFGRYDGRGAYKTLFGIKSTDVIAIETNGVKTIRVIP